MPFILPRRLLSSVTTSALLLALPLTAASHAARTSPGKGVTIAQLTARESVTDEHEHLRTDRERLLNISRSLSSQREQMLQVAQRPVPSLTIASLRDEIRDFKSRASLARYPHVSPPQLSNVSLPIALPFPLSAKMFAPWSQSIIRENETGQMISTRHRAQNRSNARSRSLSTSASVSATVPFTGIKPYWNYDEGDIPGEGTYGVNRGGQQNLVVQAADVFIPHKGVNVIFSRTYNSLSAHDYNGTDGSQISNYGDGWTNTFDAHVVFNPSLSNSIGNGVSLFDDTGARYDFTATSNNNGTIVYAPPAGAAGSMLQMNADYICWFLKNGTAECFFRPDIGSVVQGYTGEGGRLVKIFGRNRNNYLLFIYSFDSSSSTPQNLNQVTVETEIGGSYVTTLTFTDVTVGSGTRRLLTSVTRPDGTYVTYSYTATGELSIVSKPVNSSSMTACAGTSSMTPTTCLSTAYQYYSTGYNQLFTVAGPRHFISSDYAQAFVAFAYQSNSNSIFEATYHGVDNPTIPDGFSSGLLQPNVTAAQPGLIRVTSYSVASGGIQQIDNDGHNVFSTYSSNGTLTGQTTSVSEGGKTVQLAYGYSYDSNYDLTAYDDPTGSITDYLYDSSGNLIASALPAPSTNSARPTTTYSYDSAGLNLTAYCNPDVVNASGGNWGSSPPAVSDSLCSPSSSGARSYTSTATSMEPYGELTSVTDEVGYVRSLTYATQPQGGTDYGLVTQIQGTAISQPGVNSQAGVSRTPTVQFTYDKYGNVLSSANGIGTTNYSYSFLNQPVSSTDADGVSGPVLSYYPNGQLESSQNPFELAANVSTSFKYNGDGDETQATTYTSCSSVTPCSSAPTTNYYYDGDDRLVEVVLPLDKRYDAYTYPWALRYYYDLTQGGTVSIGSTTGLNAYGGLFKKQGYLYASTVMAPTVQSISTGTWQDETGTSYDALNRPVMAFDLGKASSPQDTYTYDQAPNFGLLAGISRNLTLNGSNETASFSYDLARRFTGITYSDGGVTPNENYSYDPASRLTSALSSKYGSTGYRYDAAGRLTSETESSTAGITDPSTMTLTRYPDGKPEYLSITPETAGQYGVQNLFTWTYQTDGLLLAKGVNLPEMASGFSYSYSPAGRLIGKIDPSSGAISSTGSGRFGAYEQTFNNSKGGNGGLVRTSLPDGGVITVNAFDDEGAPISETRSFPLNNVTGIFTQGYTLRGEIGSTTTAAAPSPAPTSGSYSSSSTSTYVDGLACASCAQINTLDSVPESLSNPSRQLTFDGEGRVTTETNCNANGTLKNSFDFEDHTIGLQFTGYRFNSTRSCGPIVSTGSVSYVWGSNGHPDVATYSISSGPDLAGKFQSLHWFGDSLLFTTDSSGTPTDVKVGLEGDVAGTVSQIIDRDWSGSPASFRKINSQTTPSVGWTPSDTIDDPFNSSAGASSFPDNAQGVAPVLTPTADTVWDGFTVFQGQRVYDLNSGSFSSGDALQGDLASPATQSGYTRDLNNGFEYSDPSGFDAAAPAPCPPDFDVCANTTFPPQQTPPPDPDSYTIVFGGFGNFPSPLPPLKTIATVVAHGNKTKCPEGGGAGLLVGAGVGADLGDGPVGATITGSGGAGVFNGKNGPSVGATFSGGLASYVGSSYSGIPNQTSAPFAFGAYFGGGPQISYTNAQSVQALSGPFDTYSFNVGLGPIAAGFQVAIGGGTYQVSVQPPIPVISDGLGASFSHVVTNTIAYGSGCKN